MRISTVADIIRQQGSQRPDQPAFVYGSRSVSFGDLDTRSSRVANGLRSEGVGSQDRVGVKRVVVVGPHPLHESYEAWLARQEAKDPNVIVAADDVALQLYSSGTTGLPKGVMLTHDSCLFSFAQLHDTLDFSDDWAGKNRQVH
jgi:acyl-CoA synthetase (AMP-forming)/AMP-acid ligase II